MPVQHTAPEVIEHEKSTIKEVVGLDSTDRIELNDRGWDSRVYTFDGGQHFFKFPRSAKIQGRYQYEIAALEFVAELNTHIATPKIMWQTPGNAYFGYEGVQGKPLWVLADNMDGTNRTLIGRAIGKFLAAFHTLAIPGARVHTVDTEIEQLQHRYQEYYETFEQLLTAAERHRLDEHVSTIWPRQLRELGADRTLCHGDLHFENILISAEGQIGIIDFGDVGYYDRSKDFIYLEKPDFTQAVREAYGPIDGNFEQRLSLRRDITQIMEIVFYVGKHDQEHLETAMSKLAAAMRKNPQ